MVLRKRLKNKLANVISPEALNKIFSSFDIIGNIVIIKIPSSGLQDASEIAKQIMHTHKNVKSVFLQKSPVKDDFRVRELILLAGENKTITNHKENGCVFSVDVKNCYFSPRLSFERSRIANKVLPNEKVVNMFSGVGCFSILIAKKVHSAIVYSIDINPIAYNFMQDNVKLNGVYGRVFPLLGDSKKLVLTNLQGLADRVLMLLPEKALEYLPYALSALKKEGGWIHYYDFQHASKGENPLEKTQKKVADTLDNLGVFYVFSSSRIVRPIGPNWYQTVLDININESPSKFL